MIDQDSSITARRQIHANVTLAVLALLVLCGCDHRWRQEGAAQAAAEAHLVLLTSDRLEVGIMPQAGGRVVLLRQPGGRNLLVSDPAKWTPADRTPEPTATSHFQDFNGHEIWLGPQQDWWAQQTVNADRGGRRAAWPPDPWLNTGRFEIIERSPTGVALRGPASPVSGLRVDKEFRIQADGSLLLRTVAVNMRQEPVAWDLWSLTRVPGRSSAYVPIEQGEGCRIEYAANDPVKTGAAPHQTRDGVFFFDCRAPFPRGWSQASAKAFLDPAQGWIACFNADACLVKRAVIVPKDRIHPSHAFIEIFVALPPPPEAGLMELEFHSEYRRLQPGESLACEETWTLLPYAGSDSADGHIAFLKEHGLLPAEAGLPPGGP